MFEKFEKENLDTELSITNNTILIVLINPETFSKKSCLKRVTLLKKKVIRV